MAPPSTDRNLLFGVLALQTDLLDPSRFAEICSAWAGRKDTPLADLLVERGWLTPQDRADVERLLERKLHKHAGDEHASLTASTGPEAHQILTKLLDTDVQKSVADLPERGGHVLMATVAYQPQGRERYTLTHLHAAGGLGQVWLAHDSDLGRDVALKELRNDRVNQPEILARFMEEAKITGQLEHPGIVPVYELARRANGEQPFYTMRFVRGRTLSQATRHYHERRSAGEAGPLELRELLNAFVGVCNAVAYAHSRAVLHRDLKGQNVVLGDFGEVMVLDWGLAKAVGHPLGETVAGETLARPVVSDGGGARGETLQGQVLGTPAYMAPEQAEGRHDLMNERSDIYGLGAILYEILTGQPPFTGDTQEVLQKVIHQTPPRPRTLVPTVPAALEAVCLKALAKRPWDRYGSAKALAGEVQHWLAGEPVAAYSEPWTARARRWMSRHRTLVTAGAAAVFVAVVCLAAATVLLGDANHSIREARDLAERREREAAEQRDNARANFKLARDAVDEYCTKVSDDPRLK
jgi:tRNA A-37 threonylcarbamoyl transferase component Bud32